MERSVKVIGSDINQKMLAIAKAKAQKKNKDFSIKGDMRVSRIGQFDAIITIFNAVRHLTKIDFEKAINNIRYNLKDNGLYVLTYLIWIIC